MEIPGCKYLERRALWEWVRNPDCEISLLVPTAGCVFIRIRIIYRYIFPTEKEEYIGPVPWIAPPSAIYQSARGHSKWEIWTQMLHHQHRKLRTFKVFLLTEMTRRALRGLPRLVQRRTLRPEFLQACWTRGTFSAKAKRMRCAKGGGGCGPAASARKTPSPKRRRRSNTVSSLSSTLESPVMGSISTAAGVSIVAFAPLSSTSKPSVSAIARRVSAAAAACRLVEKCVGRGEWTRGIEMLGYAETWWL